jgi:tetratricopeptide (TPR) repeat protein
VHLFRAVVFVAIALSAAARGAAQNDVVARARTAAASGQRAEALTMLERHLADSPRDVDARLAYGLILSWDGRYDDARAALKQALAQAPTYNDARVALMNVEYWSGQSAQARQLADQILSADPDNTTARAVRDRLAAAARAWQAITTYTVDSFSGDRAAWQEASLSLTRKTKVGSAIVRATQADRYDETDQLFEAEFYPRFRPGTYAFVSAGISAKATLYPEFRLAGDLYQSLGHGYELSVGGRYLHFTSPTTIYVGTLSK